MSKHCYCIHHPGPSSTGLHIAGHGSTLNDANGMYNTTTMTTTTTTTPVRRSKLHLPKPKPHTLARTDLTRARTQHHQPSDLVKSHSASNSPYPRKVILEDHNPASLANSIDKDNLERSIAAMLRSADTSMEASSLQFSSEARPFWSISASCNQLGLGLGSSSGNSAISLLKQLSDIVCQYYDDPPEFNIDGSRPFSALNVHTESSGEYLSESSEEKVRYTTHLSPMTVNLMKVSGRLGALQCEAVAMESSPPREMSQPSQRVQCIKCFISRNYSKGWKIVCVARNHM